MDSVNLCVNRREWLLNGLQIIKYQNPSVHAAAIGFYFHAGPVYEEKNVGGISHLLEHLCYRRLHDLPQAELYRQLNLIGATMRGSTYRQYIGFQIQIAPQFFNQGLEIMQKLLVPHNWTQEEIKSEKRVVLRQIEQRYFDFFERANKKCWHESKFCSPIMGTKSNIQSLSKKQIQLWSSKVYDPRNAIVIFTGNFTEDSWFSAKEKLSQFPRISTNSFDHPLGMVEGFGHRNSASIYLEDNHTEFAEIQLSFDVDTNRTDRCAVELLNSILGQGDGSKLCVIREILGLTDEIYTSLSIYPNNARLVVEYTVKNVWLIESVRHVFDILVSIQSTITADDLQQVVTFYTNNLYFLLDNPLKLNQSIVDDIMINPEMSIALEEIAASYESVSLTDLCNAAKTIFTKQNLSISISRNPKLVKNKSLEMALNRLREIL